MNNTWFEWENNNLLVHVRALPHARQDGFADVVNAAIKLRLAAPPADGKANSHLKAFLARYCNVAK